MGLTVVIASLLASVASSGGLTVREAVAKTPSRSGTTHRVIIEQLRFEPAVLTVRRGDRVLWVNEDPIPHTATAVASAKATPARKAFDSGSIPAGGSWSYRATVAGEYDYGCSFHPTMKGKLIVR